MTTNAFIFSWDCNGVESIVPIQQYEHWDKENTMRLLREEEVKRNPLNNIIQYLVMRASLNPQRHYEIYAVDCDEELDEKFWKKRWQSDPQGTANLIREHGHKIYSDRKTKRSVIE